MVEVWSLLNDPRRPTRDGPNAIAHSANPLRGLEEASPGVGLVSPVRSRPGGAVVTTSAASAAMHSPRDGLNAIAHSANPLRG